MSKISNPGQKIIFEKINHTPVPARSQVLACDGAKRDGQHFRFEVCARDEKTLF